MSQRHQRQRAHFDRLRRWEIEMWTNDCVYGHSRDIKKRLDCCALPHIWEMFFVWDSRISEIIAQTRSLPASASTRFCTRLRHPLFTALNEFNHLIEIKTSRWTTRNCELLIRTGRRNSMSREASQCIIIVECVITFIVFVPSDYELNKLICLSYCHQVLF